MTEQQLQDLCTLIRTAGARAQTLRNAGLQVETKGRQDFVSQADVWVEQEIKNWLKEQCPQDGFLGEESGLSQGERGIWVLDPVDGTTNFIQDMDYWCLSLAYVYQDAVQLGIIYAPDRDEFFLSRRGGGSFLNGQRLTLRDPSAEKVIIGLGRSSRGSVSSYASSISATLNAGMEYRRFGAGALMLAHVAAGQIHGYYEEWMNSWDALAGILLITEAGGISNDFLANNGLRRGNRVVAGCPDVQERLTALFAD